MSSRPEIILSSIDAERLDALVASQSFFGRADLEAELARAKVVDPQDVPADVVTMNSTVKFSVEGSGDDIELTLVYPKDVEDSGRTISILAPVGSALLGLSQGDAIDWPKPGGGQIRLTVREVTFQPERSGTYHR